MLRIEGVSAAIAGVQVLRSVSLGLTSGRTTILIGRNGAGKTTTLRAIMGLLPVQGGSVRLDGEEIGTTPAYRRAAQGIGYAPEDRRLVPEFRGSRSCSMVMKPPYPISPSSRWMAG